MLDPVSSRGSGRPPASVHEKAHKTMVFGGFEIDTSWGWLTQDVSIAVQSATPSKSYKVAATAHFELVGLI